MAFDGITILLLTMYIVMTVAFIGLFTFVLLRIKAERAEFDRWLQQIVSDNDLVEVSETKQRVRPDVLQKVDVQRMGD
ncbi:hypothetical protein COL922a_004919 [Colletotrichum nupharicola]|nr:hypothetical protein COL922a_004919 [Colletotrichum nupharicola]